MSLSHTGISAPAAETRPHEMQLEASYLQYLVYCGMCSESRVNRCEFCGE
jgi:hypothetical protein